MSQETPGTRVTEAELLEHEGAPICPCGIAPSLVAEIRRSRALLIALVATHESGRGDRWDCPLCAGVGEQNRHESGCPWPELEAEVQAIRAERTPSGRPTS